METQEKDQNMITTEFINTFYQTITPEGKELIHRFFIVFSRFECALKASYATTCNNNNNNIVHACWDAFLASMTNYDSVKKTESINNAIDYLTKYPPKIQTLQDHQLGWKEKPFDSNHTLIENLSWSIRRIRNNLFHGGKFNSNYENGVSRNHILLENAIVILEHWLQLKDTVKQNFLTPVQ
jgi:hypothetical protein